jgi:hypothetical protein
MILWLQANAPVMLVAIVDSLHKIALKRLSTHSGIAPQARIGDNGCFTGERVAAYLCL